MRLARFACSQNLLAPLLLGLLMVCLVGLSPAALAAGRGEPGRAIVARVDLVDAQNELILLGEMKIDIDAVFPGWARVYILEEELEKLRHLGFSVTIIPDEVLRPSETLRPWPTVPTERSIPAAYHTYATLTSELQAIAAAHPEITRLYTIGLSVQGRELWMMKITDNPDVDEDEPEAAYISSMHGDEVVGKELCIGLINYLVDNYGTDSRVTDLVDDTEMWIMPSMNPDGTELDQRYNANGFDLNRSFPDWFSDPVNTPGGRPAETRAVMLWTLDRTLGIAANFHGGAMVVNYPWDNNPSGSSVFSPTDDPDQPALLSISESYAHNNPTLYNSNTSPFVHGVTNGAEWYAIDGGMQDWAYAWYGIFETTIELGNTKWPSASTLPGHWDDNLESMLTYFERVHDGVRGIVYNAATGAPIAAEVRLEANPIPTYTDPDVGDYHRIVLPGSYTMQVTAVAYEPQTLPIEVLSGSAVRYDVGLAPLPANLQPVATRVEDGPSGNGYLDPDETAALAVTLKNFGYEASGITARLVPTGWFTEIARAQADYPNLAPAQSGESLAPYHEVRVDPAVPAGHKVGFALEWVAAQGYGTSEPFFLDVGAPASENVPATDVPQAIPDYQTTTSDVDISSGFTVAEVFVAVDISHTFIGDLLITLHSPSGTSVVLHDRTGSGTNDIFGTYGDDLTPAEPLSDFIGEPADGTWQLEIRDMAGGDTGTLNSWTLQIGGQPQEATAPEMRFHAFERDPGGVAMQWWSYPGLTSYRVYRSTDPSSAAAFVDVTAEDGNATDTAFVCTSTEPTLFYLVTGVGPNGEGLKGHFGE